MPLAALEDDAFSARILGVLPWLFLQCHVSSPLPWHLPPKKLVSRSGQPAAPALVTSQKGDPGIVVSV